MIEKNKVFVCFRNDDVNELTPELKNLTQIFINNKIPITHAVEPGNITEDTTKWLKNIKKNYPKLLEIAQHGWNHSCYFNGEFDSSRSYKQQYIDLKNGQDRLIELFGKNFFQMLTIPFGVYNHKTIKAASNLKYKVICKHHNYRTHKRLFYFIGNTLGKGQVFGRNVSNHLKYCQRTNMLEINTSISFIKKYYGHNTNICDMHNVNQILDEFRKFRKYTQVVVLLLHHRFHYKKEHHDLVKNSINRIKNENNVEFTDYAGIYKLFSNSK